MKHDSIIVQEGYPYHYSFPYYYCFYCLLEELKQLIITRGNFLSANLDKASSDNERNAIQIRTDDGASIWAVQIADLITRWIACWIKTRDIVKKGIYVLPNLFTTAFLFAVFRKKVFGIIKIDE